MYVFLIMLALLCAACSSDDSSSSVEQPNKDTYQSNLPDTLKAMSHVHAYNKKGMVGTLSPVAKLNETPQMSVSFDYDFLIGEHEVTCGEFKNKMKTVVECDNDSLPVSNVTFFDAVLFANERSKAENFDTAYTYKSAAFDKDDHCISLEGFSFHPDKDAYRLPTEAEWMLAAQNGWNPAEGWNASNADYKAHKICTANKVTNSLVNGRLCDMAGNVAEWVNDWLGIFRDTVIADYAGAPDGGALGERVIKGGSFRNDVGNTTLYARGDVYMVTSSMKADYVGFRLAFGTIPNATWLGADGSASDSRMVPLANSNTVKKQTGSFRTKLAFRNDATRNLSFLDYSDGTLAVTEIKDTLDVYHPEISPDGKLVAFCTGVEGVPGKSSLYVRDLDASGKHLVKLDVESAAVPRWRVLASGDTVIVYVSSAENNSDAGSFAEKSTWQVSFKDGKFGTPKKLFDGAFHGGISYDDQLAVTGARLLRARIAQKESSVMETATDTVWYGSEQACNASMSRDGSKRTLFLDFGGKTGREFAGSKYGTHEMLLVNDSTGTLIQGVPSPKGFSFDHTEWTVGDTLRNSPQSGLVVLTLVNSNGAHVKIALLNTADSSLTELVEGDELWHPCLWISPTQKSTSSDWNLDSLGVYRTNRNTTYTLLANKMPMFWAQRDSAVVVGLGNSHMWAGFAPATMKYKSINMGVWPCDMHCISYLVENYVLNHYSQVKYLVVGLDFDLWYNANENEDINSNTRESAGFAYDKNHHFWVDQVNDEFVSLVWDAAKTEAYSWDQTKGWYNEVLAQGWVDSDHKVEILQDSIWSDLTEAYMSNLNKLYRLIEMADNRGIKVIGLIFPLSPDYKNTGSYGRHGMRRSTAMQIVEELKKLEVGGSNFIIMDENKFGDHDYTDDMALDFDHLNFKGAVQLTTRLDSLIMSLEK